MNEVKFIKIITDKKINFALYPPPTSYVKSHFHKASNKLILNSILLKNFSTTRENGRREIKKVFLDPNSNFKNFMDKIEKENLGLEENRFALIGKVKFDENNYRMLGPQQALDLTNKNDLIPLSETINVEVDEYTNTFIVRDEKHIKDLELFGFEPTIKNIKLLKYFKSMVLRIKKVTQEYNIARQHYVQVNFILDTNTLPKKKELKNIKHLSFNPEIVNKGVVYNKF